MGLFEAFGAVILVLILIALLATGFLVYRDAKQTGASHPRLWGGLTVVTGLGGALLYLIVERFDLLNRHLST